MHDPGEPVHHPGDPVPPAPAQAVAPVHRVPGLHGPDARAHRHGAQAGRRAGKEVDIRILPLSGNLDSVLRYRAYLDYVTT